MSDRLATGDYFSPSDDAVKLMQDRLKGTERDTTELAKMLVDLGISPNGEDGDKYTHDENQIPNTDKLLSEIDDLISSNKEGCKTVTFAPNSSRQQTNRPQNHASSILKKSTVPPLRMHYVTNQTSETNIAASQYQQMVARICKSESVIQTLKLSLCALQTSKEVSEREKVSVIERLKTEIDNKQLEIDSSNQRFQDALRNGSDAERRWQEAEKEVNSLQDQLQEISEKQQGKFLMSDEDMRLIREKSVRRIRDAKEEAVRERSLRKSLEESHATLLTRVQDVESNVEHERKQVENLRKECDKLEDENKKFRKQSSEWTKRAKEMDITLKNLKDELDSKERAIKTLVNEQNTKEQESHKLESNQGHLQKQLKECNIVLEAQKGAFCKLENENKEIRSQLVEANLKIEQLNQDLLKNSEEHMHMIRNKETENCNKIEGLEKQLQKDLKLEKQRASELEERIRILEDCVKQQEKIIQEKETENMESTEDSKKRVENERQKYVTICKEREEALRAKESSQKEIAKLKSQINHEKGLLENQLQELQLEHDTIVEAKRLVEEENGRLMERSSAVQQQESAYKRMQDTLTVTNEAKSKLAYEKGKLQTRVEQLQEELQAVAATQSQLVQMQSTNSTLEQKYSRAASELAAAKIECQRMEVEVKQMRVAMKRKESEFEMALTSRDTAIREKSDVESQMESIKEKESIKIQQLKRSLTDCKADNARMADTLENIMIRHNDLQSTLDTLQTQLGRKDSEVAALAYERQEFIQKIQSLSVDLNAHRAQLNNFNANEEARITPVLEALEKTRQENLHLSSSLDEVLETNTRMKSDLEKLKADLDSKQRQLDSLKRREESLIIEAENITQAHAERMQQGRDQFQKERDVLRKQLQTQIIEMKKSLEATQTRCSQLTKGNTELRGKLAEKVKQYENLKARAKTQKAANDRLQKERQLNSQTSEKIKEINDDLQDLEKVKRVYMEKNKQQLATINTFNSEVDALKSDILALTAAQRHSKDVITKYEKRFEEEAREKRASQDKVKQLLSELDKVKKEKADADERLRKVQLETMHVQQNLNEAQTWFTEKFENLQAELKRSKGVKNQREAEWKSGPFP